MKIDKFVEKNIIMVKRKRDDERMVNWYKPGPVRTTRTKPDPRPPKPKPDWKEYSDLLDYQAKNIEKVRRRIERSKRK